ncbi:MAG: amino acid ABC transporter permease [Succinatimonas sp.]|nr:amino acid ABC transporter permease [Succinatimonas sp.]
MEEWIASFNVLTLGPVWAYIVKGTLFTVIISTVSVILSIIIGAVLALVRNYCNAPRYLIFKWMASLYIEVFRNTPLLLWIFVGVVFCPVPDFFGHPLFGLSSVETKMLFKASMALTVYTSSVIAEIIRGGLNAVPKGQFETAYTQGFGIVGTMYYVILPQALRNVVPTLLSQIITTIKDSSFLANVATIELMSRVRKILSSANVYNGLGTINVSDVFVLYGTAAVIYFIINFSLSLWVRRLQAKRGVTA